MRSLDIPLSIPTLTDEDIHRAVEVMRSGMLVYGEVGRRVEARIASMLGADHSVLLFSNGTATLHTALLAAGVGRGDKVIVPAFSYVATANVVEMVGATPVFVDVDIDTLNLDVGLLEPVSGAKAIIPVHEFGFPADMDAVNEFAGRNGLVVIEDAACAFGSRYNGRPAGTLADFGSFSLHPRKSLTTGEGGILTVRSREMLKIASEIRNHGIGMGKDGRPGFTNAGLNYRLTDIQSALLEGQLERSGQIFSKRAAIASRYERFITHPLLRKPYMDVDKAKFETTWQSYHVILDERVDRDLVIGRLAEKGIGTNYGAQCIPDTPYYRDRYGFEPGLQFPNAYRAYHKGLVLPLYDRMDMGSADRVIEELKTILDEYGE
jgi:perosamine synthetase